MKTKSMKKKTRPVDSRLGSTMGSMRASDPLAYLVGSRAAILRLASSRMALWVGLILVITAGIARHYDRGGLLTDFRWIYGPIAVSLVSSLLVFLALFVGLRLRDTKVGFRAQYCSFLGLFWMTAPMAWIYAIPVERWCDPLLAAKWNLLFLAIVATWRVLLISRAVSVATNRRFGVALLFVLIPASLEMAAATLLIRVDYNVVAQMATAEARSAAQLMTHAANVFRIGALIVLGSASVLAVVRMIWTSKHQPA